MTFPEDDDDPRRWQNHPADWDPHYYGPPDPPERPDGPPDDDDPRRWLDPEDVAELERRTRRELARAGRAARQADAQYVRVDDDWWTTPPGQRPPADPWS